MPTPSAAPASRWEQVGLARMMKSIFRIVFPVVFCCFEQLKGASYIRLDKLIRTLDRIVNMGFGRKVYHRVYSVFIKDAVQQGRITSLSVWTATKMDPALQVASGAASSIKPVVLSLSLLSLYLLSFPI